MHYLKVTWHHKSPEDPLIIWSEIDENGYELRKVEKYADGRLGFADASNTNGGSALGEFPVPAFAEISQHREFSPVNITAREFNKQWAAAVSAAQGVTERSQKAGRRVRVFVRANKAAGGAKRSLKVTQAPKGWAITNTRGKTIQVLATQESAIKRAKDILGSTSGTRVKSKKSEKHAKGKAGDSSVR